MDLQGPLRERASDGELVGLMQGEMRRKARGHDIDKPGFVQPKRPMSSTWRLRLWAADVSGREVPRRRSWRG